METEGTELIFLSFENTTFNFLASLINGNNTRVCPWLAEAPTFNFLASLINGNNQTRKYNTAPKRRLLTS